MSLVEHNETMLLVASLLLWFVTDSKVLVSYVNYRYPSLYMISVYMIL